MEWEPDARMFWHWIELAWRAIPNGARIRAGIVCSETEDVDQALASAIAALAVIADSLTVDGLRVYCREFDRHMLALDREDLASHIALGDDGFMDARATILVLGEDHYRAVTADVRCARPQVGVQKALHVGTDAWQRRFGATLSYPRFASRCTASNPDGWPRVRERQAREKRVADATQNLSAQLGLGRVGLRVAAEPARTVTLPDLAPGELASVLRLVAAKLSAEGG